MKANPSMINQKFRVDPKKMGEVVAMDLLCLDEHTKGLGGGVAVLVAVDVFSKLIIVQQLSDTKAETVLIAAKRVFLTLKVNPSLLKLDRQSAFISKVFTNEMTNIGIPLQAHP